MDVQLALIGLALYVLAVMSGAQLIDMAIFGGIVWVLVPELLKSWNINQNWGFVIFGVLGVQALTSGTNLGQIIRDLIHRRTDRRQAAARAAQKEAAARETADQAHISTTTVATLDPAKDANAPVLVVEGLTVEFGALKALDDVPVEPLAGKVVLDTVNYYPERDGQVAELDENRTTTSELVAAHLPDSHVVKAFNNIYFEHLGSMARPAGAPDRTPGRGSGARTCATWAACVAPTPTARSPGWPAAWRATSTSIRSCCGWLS